MAWRTFWRMASPPTENGASIVRSPTPGEPLFVTAWVRDPQGRAVADAEIDVWQASTEGYYENQDPVQADMNLRGKFRTDARGRIAFRSVRPAAYPIPVDGPLPVAPRVTWAVRSRGADCQTNRTSCQTTDRPVRSAVTADLTTRGPT